MQNYHTPNFQGECFFPRESTYLLVKKYWESSYFPGYDYWGVLFSGEHLLTVTPRWNNVHVCLTLTRTNHPALFKKDSLRVYEHIRIPVHEFTARNQKSCSKWFFPVYFCFRKTLVTWEQGTSPNNLREADFKKSSTWLVFWYETYVYLTK